MAAGSIEKVGETGLELTIEFPDEQLRDDFDIAFRAWLKEYQRITTPQHVLNSLVERGPQADDDDTAGYIGEARWHQITLKDGKVFSWVDYTDWLPFI